MITLASTIPTFHSCYHIAVSQTCQSCLWISSDEVEECERCGERFDGQHKPEISGEAVGGVVRTVVGVLALALLGFLIFQRFGGNISDVTAGARSVALGFYTWILGPNEFFKPYLVIMLVIIAITWVVLWLLAQFRQ
jgi:hypothetical protein